MKFDPISEKEAEAQSSNLWPDGEYDYEIKEAEDGESKAGNDMIKMQVWIYNQSGSRRMIFDYLVSTIQWKVRRFANSCGLGEQYEKGNLLSNEIVGRTGRCKVGTDKGDGSFPPKNVVRDYMKGAGKQASDRRSVVSAGVDDLSDEIPF